MKQKILLADNLHFHKRGFKSLIEFMEKKGIEHIFVSHKNKELLCKYGNYESSMNDFKNYYNLVSSVSEEDLFNFKYSTIKVFPLVMAEILTYVMTLKDWYDSAISYDEKEIFKKLLKENKKILLQNMAVALYWIDFWKSILHKYSHYSHCCVFSGTLIYQKTLIKLAQNSRLEIMLFEHFFTGNDYYCEHKYQHLPNNSDIKFKNYYQNTLKIDFNSNLDLEKEKIKAINKIILSNNKNVVQPKQSDKIYFDNSNGIILVLGQVLNDFSILETRLKNISTISFYKELFVKIIENSNYNIIFKSHPWEQKKANLSKSLTYEELTNFINKKSYSKRIKIVEEYNLKTLINQSNLIVTLCSQSAIEAAFEGKKVIQLGKSFYGKKGFTYDFDSIEEFISQINSLVGTLTLEEYKYFEEFLVKVFQLHLVSVHPSGIKVLEEKFKILTSINIATPTLKLDDVKKTEVTKKVNKNKKPNVKPIKKNKVDKESVISTPEKINNILKNNTKVKIFLQELKKVPLIGPSLLWFKHNILRWK